MAFLYFLVGSKGLPLSENYVLPENRAVDIKSVTLVLKSPAEVVVEIPGEVVYFENNLIQFTYALPLLDEVGYYRYSSTIVFTDTSIEKLPTKVFSVSEAL